MGITSLDAALSGLRISQQQISVISNNVANVGTPGYSRKILPQSTQAINGQSVGVRPGIITRNVDLNLERDLWTQVSSVEFFDVQETYLNRIQQFHGPPDRELSIASEIADLRDSFAILADSPEDTFALANAVNQAQDTADKINDLASLINTLRNDVQDEVSTTVTRINDLLVQVASLNDQVESNQNNNRTSALMEDQRDEVIKELSQLIEISFFQRGDGVLVIQTNNGIELASDSAKTLYFDSTPLAATTSYPDSINGIFVGDPILEPSAVDITTISPGGKLGGLLELRDVVFPKQSAQIDELAHKMALRFDAQGLRLFTDASGAIPEDTAPDPTTLPDPTAVEYVGFASVIQVNQNILNDNTLLRTGTYGATNIQTGDNEVIRRVLQNTFTSIEYQEISNTDITTQVDLLNRGGADLQTWLGIFSSNTITGGLDLSAIGSLNDLINSSGGALVPPNDEFDIVFSETRTGILEGPATTITIDMAAAAATPGANALDQLVTYINGLTGGLPASLAVTAQAGPNGELQITTTGSYRIDSNVANGMTQTGLNFLGLTDSGATAIAPTDPYFDIQVGNNPSTRIFLEPGDTDVDLLTKLGAVEGLAVDTVNFALDGVLRLRPGNNFDVPDFGGDLQITSGPFVVGAAAYSPPFATSVRTSLDPGANIISALFGTYTIAAGNVQDQTALRDVPYGSETNASLAVPIPTVGFRNTLLGPGTGVSTGIVGATTLIDFAQKMVNEHAQDLLLKSNRKEDESSLRDLLSIQLLDESGVNLDEELGHLIVVQTAYSASARVLTAVDELFQELLNAVRR